jgi:hypothetical protein
MNPMSDMEEKAINMIIDVVLQLVSTTADPGLRQMLMYRGRLLLWELEQRQTEPRPRFADSGYSSIGL